MIFRPLPRATPKLQTAHPGRQGRFFRQIRQTFAQTMNEGGRTTLTSVL